MTNILINSWTNTHFYDNKISTVTLERINKFIQNNNITKEEKLNNLSNLRELLINKSEGNKSEGNIYFYDKIVESYINEDGKNYDDINKLDAIDLLHLISLFFIHNSTKTCQMETIKTLLNDQLEDMKTGFCPQGRTIRLVQIIDSFVDSFVDSFI